MLAAFALVAGYSAPASKPTPFPFPQDCSRFNQSATQPKWYTGCASAAGGCFSIKVPEETKYNIGNTTFGATKAGGVADWLGDIASSAAARASRCCTVCGAPRLLALQAAAPAAWAFSDQGSVRRGPGFRDGR